MSQWLLEGDKNTKCFHALTAQRRNQNKIEQLEKESGGLYENAKDIAKEIYEFYEQLFTTAYSIGWEEKLERIPKFITHSKNSINTH